MSLLCDLNNMLNDQIYSIYSQSGYRILTNEEYNKEIKSSIQELSTLYRDNIIDTSTFTSCVTIMTGKFIENHVEAMFSIGPRNDYWALPAMWESEKHARK